MKKRGNGVVINLTSILGVRGASRHGAYTASKAAVSNLTSTLHQEVCMDGVRVHAIAPGLTDTALARDSVDEDYIQTVGATYPGGRLGQPEDLTELVQFLSSSSGRAMAGGVSHLPTPLTGSRGQQYGKSQPSTCHKKAPAAFLAKPRPTTIERAAPWQASSSAKSSSATRTSMTPRRAGQPTTLTLLASIGDNTTAVCLLRLQRTGPEQAAFCPRTGAGVPRLDRDCAWKEQRACTGGSIECPFSAERKPRSARSSLSAHLLGNASSSVAPGGHARPLPDW